MNIPEDVLESLAGTEYQFGEMVTKDDLLERIERARKAGHVHVYQVLAVTLFRVDTSQMCGDQKPQLQRQ